MHSTPTEALGARARPRNLRSAALSAPELPAGRLVVSLEDGRVIEDHGPAFEDFYLGARTSIVRALSLALGDVDLALEATDEAMARAYERWPTVARSRSWPFGCSSREVIATVSWFASPKRSPPENRFSLKSCG